MHQISFVGPDKISRVEETRIAFGLRPVQRVLKNPEFCSLTELIAALFEKQGELRPQVKASKILEKGNIFTMPYEELIFGVGLSALESARLIAALELSKRRKTTDIGSKKLTSPVAVYELLREEMAFLEQEEFRVLYLNTKNKLIKIKTISVGTLNSAIISPREVYQQALRLNAAAVVAVHNHPSGDPTPSREDKDVTKRLAEAGKILNVSFLDHIIIGTSGFCSLKEEGVIE
jgi:DNA repair protein RadC